MRFDSCEFLSQSADASPYALIVLNQPLAQFWKPLFRKANFKICCDGGANHLYDTLAQDERQNYLPDAVVGDFDGIRADVKDYYTEQKCIVRKVESQDDTDFEKAMNLLLEHEKASGVQHTVVAIGAFGGRFDHNFANIQISYRFPTHKIYLLADGNMGFLLAAEQQHEIIHNKEFEDIKCGLVPLGEPAKETFTTGLRWNLDGQEMKFGALISTNNEVAEDTITIRSSHTLFFTMELHHPPKFE
eukprot:TRINITY_DN19104_c0_g1_i1.p1 TRINITY_DN19104_c0_g1~~TRINITY_DN19104_c0_g1_i1.p1  ORF type:complete len:245 (+),score=59.07 TRINITY_DN19104_c0_g1_i1:45-779(+)